MKIKTQKLPYSFSIATVMPSTLVTMTDSKSVVENGRLESFTFEKQKKFPYIKKVFAYVEKNIPKFKEIWPYLGAYTTNGQWDLNIDEDLEIIGISHFTILKSFGYIYQNKGRIVMNDPYQRYKNIVFHYALILDCIKQISFHIIKFKNKLDPSIKIPTHNYSKEKFLEKMSTWYDENYEKQFAAFSISGGLVLKEIHSVSGYISMLNKECQFDTFNKFKEIIGPLRNVFIHNPSIDIFYRWDKFLVVRPEYIKTHRTIQSINNLNPKNLIEPKVLMNNLFRQATTVLSDVWNAFYQRNRRNKYASEL